ncbi:MAG: DEAD/DEAH box helicase [Thermoplasmata archaeon]|nr:MAG: DEAD/DEAH box helicase [Thermoplasmata archaeon]
MNVEDLEIDAQIIHILKSQGITELYPPQEEAIEYALQGMNLVLAVPTASGKSLVAYLAVLKWAMQGHKVLYIVPLRALASEKYEDLKEFEVLGVKIGISMGDYDIPDPTLRRFDILVATSEKADSLLRHKVDWLNKLKLIVADEVHLINDSSRGPTLEVILARFKQINPDAQIIALSATIKNSSELADWLEAVHIKSDWRPVPLKEGIFMKNEIQYTDNSIQEIDPEGEDVHSLILDCVKDNYQCLVFVNNRKSTESLAGKVGKKIAKILDEKELKALDDVSLEILERQSEPTIIGKRLASYIKNGAAFHNAGLTNQQRKSVESAFKNGHIRCIVATPTLAAGINLPARRVIIRDYKRYEANYGSIPIPNLEIKQMSGRAGRPQYDDVGEAVLMAKSEKEKDFLLENYLLSDTEAITSKLGTEPALRNHLLALIASEIAETEEEIDRFIQGTFFAHLEDIWTISGRIQSTLIFLVENDLVQYDDRYRATRFGKKTSSLYIDPLSAVRLRAAIENVAQGKVLELAILHAVSATPDMIKLYLGRGDYPWVSAKVMEHEKDFLLLVPKDENEFDFFLAEVKTASLLEAWISEVPEDEIVRKFNVGPGDIRNKVETAEWITYSMLELARLFKCPHLQTMEELVTRLRYGVKRDLMPLIQLEQVGRVRARALYGAGFHKLEDLRGVPVGRLATIPTIGPKIAENIVEQLEKGRLV